ncbi:MAG: hypothetical protein ACR2KV_10710 [Solirubrobacteraceae bacterium]
MVAIAQIVACGDSGTTSRPTALSVAQAWAAAQRAGQARRACDLSSAESVRALGGRPGCEQYMASRPFGANARVDPSGAFPLSPDVFAITDPEPNATGYGWSVQVVSERGALRVRFHPHGVINVSLPPITRPARPVRCPSGFRAARVFDARTLLGLVETQARTIAGRSGCTIAVDRRDGHDLPLLAKIDLGRIQVEVVRRVVVTIRGVS